MDITRDESVRPETYVTCQVKSYTSEPRLAKPSDKAASWLRWHAALVEKTGPGAIVRVIAEVDRTA